MRKSNFLTAAPRAVQGVVHNLLKPFRGSLPTSVSHYQPMVLEACENRSHVNTSISPGLNISYFGSNSNGTIEMTAAPFATSRVDRIAFNQPTLTDPTTQQSYSVFRIRWDGWINAAEDGTYYFRVPNADGAIAKVADQYVIYAPSLSGDANLNGTVDFADVITITGSGAYNTGSPATWTDGDFNLDNAANFGDILAMMSAGHYNTGDVVYARTLDNTTQDPGASAAGVDGNLYTTVGIHLGAGANHFELNYFQFEQASAASFQWATPSDATFRPVDQVPPTVAPVVPQTIRAGDAIALSTSFTNAGVVQVHAAAANWGDGTTGSAEVMEDAGAGSVFATHVYPRAGVYHPTLTVANAGGASTPVTATVTVLNGAPTLASLAPQAVPQGKPVVLFTSFTDPDPFDTHTASVSWGDGTAAEPATVTDVTGGGTILASHQYAHAGAFNAVLTITDASGASAAAPATAAVSVQSVVPTVDIAVATEHPVAGQPLDLTARASDPTTAADAFNYSWTVTDLVGNTLASGAGRDFRFTPATIGRYHVNVSATRPDGATASSSATVSAADPAVTPDDSIAPLAPSGLAASSASADGVTLNWQDNSDDEQGFEILWGDGSGFYVIDVVGPGVTTYTDPDPLFNTVNSYTVAAYRGETESSNAAAVDVPIITAPTPFDDENGGFNDRDTLSPYVVVHDQVLTGASVLGDDMNLYGTPFQVVEHTSPSHGSLTIDPDGSFTYTPQTGWTGTDRFTYKASNGVETSTDAGVAIDVTNELPDAANDEVDLNLQSFVLRDGARVEGAVASSVNASDADGDPVTYSVVDDVKHGELTFDEQTGQFSYVAGTDFAGFDRFTFIANDGLGDSVPASVSIVSHTHVALPGGTIDLLPGSGGPFAEIGPGLQVADGHNVTNGTITTVILGDPVNGPTETWQTYRPDDGYEGNDPGRFYYQYGNVTGKSADLVFRPLGAPFPYGRPTTYFQVSNTEPYTAGSDGTRFAGPDVTLELNEQPQHGSVSLDPDGSFTYTPKDAKDPYYGWDFFRFTATTGDGSKVEQWVQLDVGDFVAPTAARPVADLNPQEFPSTLKGLWQAYMSAKDALGEVFKELEQLGRKADEVRDAGLDNDAKQGSAIAKLDAATQAFARYSQQAQAAFKAAGNYMRDIWYTSQADYDVLKAIQALPRDVAGLTPTKEQASKWAAALGQYDNGADFMVVNNDFVVKMATETHDALNVAIRAGGLASIAITGAQILTEQGCAAFVQLAMQQVRNTAGGIVAGYAANSAAALASRFGFDIDPDYLRIGADTVQLFSLVKAARAQRKASGANCFAAGTAVATDGGPVDIEDIHVGQRVMTGVFNSGAAGAPPPVIGDPDATEVDPATWRLVSLDMPDPADPGNDYRMQLLEPQSWIASQHASAGGWVDLDIPELGIHGRSHVDAIEACPTIDGGHGRVVLGTFQHVSHDLVDVKFAGDDTPLRVTAGHKLWSLHQGSWVQAGELRAGERLASEHGEVVVQLVTAVQDGQCVYNLDVETDHRYLVTTHGVLAHNADPCSPSFKDNFGSKVKTKLNQLRKKYPSIRKADQGGIEDAKVIATQVYNAGGGRTGPAVGHEADTAQYFDDGPVTWVFKPNGEFWSMRTNSGWTP